MTQEVIRLDQVSLWRRTQEEFSYDLKRTISFLQGKHIKPAKNRFCKMLTFPLVLGKKSG